MDNEGIMIGSVLTLMGIIMVALIVFGFKTTDANKAVCKSFDMTYHDSKSCANDDGALYSIEKLKLKMPNKGD